MIFFLCRMGRGGYVCVCYTHGVSSPTALCAPNFGQKALQEEMSVSGHWDKWVCLGNNQRNNPSFLHTCTEDGSMPFCPMSGSGGCITRPSITTADSQCQQIAAFVLGHPPPCMPLIAPFCTQGT